MNGSELALALRDARARTLALVEDLEGSQLMGDKLGIVNPLLWEIGHVAWFQERWCLRHACKREPALKEADALYDSIAVSHDTRWGLTLLGLEGVHDYMRRVLDAVSSELIRGQPNPELLHLAALSLFHEDMHGEAFTLTRQTLGFPCPQKAGRSSAAAEAPPSDAEVAYEGGTFLQGSPASEAFSFDNEHAPHERVVAPFRLASTCVTQAQFLAFVEDDGYRREELWSSEGWDWRVREAALHPVYWKCASDGSWTRRHFDRRVALEPEFPVHFVNAYEAEAFSRWSGARLPTESEWEFAAGRADYPWGDEPPSGERAHLDLRCAGVSDVNAYSRGDTPEGVRQMIGNVWEWTASPFEPYPGFRPGRYVEYSEPWFHSHRVLRGGAYATRARMIRSRFRNFYRPDRRDVLAGFRLAWS